jgi:large subunit ribosomal protein L2
VIGVEILKKHKPVTQGLLARISLKNTILYRKSSLDSLTEKKNKISGRNNVGRITIRHRGGGCKRNYRVIDWKRNKDGIVGLVKRIEYDPNRSANIALILYKDGERRYIISPDGLNIGDTVVSGANAPISLGNNVPMFNTSVGLFVNCVEMYPGCGGVFARSAGCFAQVLSVDSLYVTLRLKSGEIRKVLSRCRATVGCVGNKKYSLISIGKAGRNRLKNKRPTVRGVAMNPIDHPHGGGEGKTASGRHPCSPWGKVEGKLTRRRRKFGSFLIVSKRNSR